MMKDGSFDADASPDVIPLSAATVRALRKLSPEQDGDGKRGIDARNVIAVALSALIPVYERDPRSGKLRPMTETEFASGRFTAGGARFAFGDQRPDLEGLVVRSAEVNDAIATISVSFISERYLSAREHRPPKNPRR